MSEKVNLLEKKDIQSPLLVLRLVAVSVLVVLLTTHVRSVRAFHWEQTVSGGVLVTYVIAMVGLAIKANRQFGEQNAFQVYICATGSVLLALNAAVIYRRWRTSNALTRMVAELLGAAGVPLRRQVLTKVVFGVAAAVLLMIDVFITVLCHELTAP